MEKKKILITIEKTSRQFVIKIAMDLCIAQIVTVFICSSIQEKTLYILTGKVAVKQVVPVEFLALVRKGSIQLLREICCSNTKFFMLNHILAYQKMYVRDLQKL